MSEFWWHIIARIVCRPRVVEWLIARAKRTPYTPIMSRDGTHLYMDRWWLFNPYKVDQAPRWPWLPSIRVHHIVKPDSDAHLHDHPWNARTIVMRGHYLEERQARMLSQDEIAYADGAKVYADGLRMAYWRIEGYTGRVLFGQYHRIAIVPDEVGVYTLWFTWRYAGTWGFLVDGKKMPWREYLK